MLPARHFSSVGKPSGTEGNSPSQPQVANSTSIASNSRASNLSMDTVAPTAQATVPVSETNETFRGEAKKAKTQTEPSSPFSMNTVADALVSVAPATALKWTRLSKAHNRAILGAIPRWAKTMSFDAMAKNVPKEGTVSSKEWADFRVWVLSRFRSVLPNTRDFEILSGRPSGNYLSLLQRSIQRPESLDPIKMMASLSSPFAHGLPHIEEGAGMIPEPDPAHVDMKGLLFSAQSASSGRLCSLAIRVLPDQDLPGYFDAADAAYGPQGELPATRLLQAEKDQFASSIAHMRLIEATRENKPLAVISLLRRKPALKPIDTAFERVKYQLDNSHYTQRGGTRALAKAFDILKVLIVRLKNENAASLFRASLSELPRSVLRQNVPEDGKINVRRRQLDLVSLLKTVCADLHTHAQHPDIDFAKFKPDFILAAKPQDEQNPRVRELNDAILKALG
jgi:hypothetical protein